MKSYYPRDWVEFQGSPPPRSGKRPYVSVNPRGIIVMNRFAYGMLGEPVAVALLFDFPRFTIGIRPAGLIMPNAFPVSQRGNSTYVIQAKSFVYFNHIKPSGTFRFLDPKMENDVLVLDIAFVARTTQTPRLGWRKKKSSPDTEPVTS